SRVLPDFHELRRDFSPPKKGKLTPFECSRLDYAGQPSWEAAMLRKSVQGVFAAAKMGWKTGAGSGWMRARRLIPSTI
ncbi:MAG: hypothetical protein JW730_16405, partial [Anaerolineales bacterium]|nr:hypothetical protein [Anaerolineales bacterium]